MSTTMGKLKRRLFIITDTTVLGIWVMGINIPVLQTTHFFAVSEDLLYAWLTTAA